MGGLVLEFMTRVEKTALWSDFCERSYQSLEFYYNTVVLTSKPDPAARAIEGKEKKVSHSLVELNYLMKGAAQSIIQGYAQSL